MVPEPSARGIDYDGFTRALLAFARMRSPDEEVASARTLTEELCSAGVVLMPDPVLSSMLQRDVLCVFRAFGPALRRLFASYTADLVGVVMDWEDQKELTPPFNLLMLPSNLILRLRELVRRLLQI